MARAHTHFAQALRAGHFARKEDLKRVPPNTFTYAKRVEPQQRRRLAQIIPMNAAATPSPTYEAWDGKIDSNGLPLVSDKAEIRSLVLVIHADGLRLLLAGMLCEPIVDAACIYEQATGCAEIT